jgi:hypothetical protein
MIVVQPRIREPSSRTKPLPHVLDADESCAVLPPDDHVGVTFDARQLRQHFEGRRAEPECFRPSFLPECGS